MPRGGVQVTGIKLDQERALLYRSEDMELFEEALGGESWQRAVQVMGEKRLKLLIWCGLRNSMPDIQPAQVSRMLDAARRNGADVVTLWQTVLIALRRSGFLPEPEAAAAAVDPTPAPAPGNTADSATG